MCGCTLNRHLTLNFQEFAVYLVQESVALCFSSVSSTRFLEAGIVLQISRVSSISMRGLQNLGASPNRPSAKSCSGLLPQHCSEERAHLKAVLLVVRHLFCNTQRLQGTSGHIRRTECVLPKPAPKYSLFFLGIVIIVYDRRSHRSLS